MLTLPNGTDVRTEPEEYAPTTLKRELATIQQLTPILDAHWQQEVRELPESVQIQLRTLSFIRTTTAGGLERVQGLLWQLYTIEGLIKQLLRGESIQRSMVAAFGIAEPVSSSGQPAATEDGPVADTDQPPTSGTLTLSGLVSSPPTLTLEPSTDSVADTNQTGGTLVLPDEVG